MLAVKPTKEETCASMDPCGTLQRADQFVAAVKNFRLGMSPQFVNGGNPIEEFIRIENYSPKRKAAVGETDFVQVLLLDIIPALHYHYLLSLAKDYIDLEVVFPSKEHQDNLLWILLLMVQTARKHAYPWMEEDEDRHLKKVIRTPKDILKEHGYGW